MSFELIISVIALVVSILSPIFTAWINKSKELKLKELEVYEKRKLDNLEQYYQSVSACLLNEDGVTTDFIKNKFFIYMYAPEDISEDIESLHLLCSYYGHGSIPHKTFRMVVDEGNKLLAKVVKACAPATSIPWWRKLLNKPQHRNKKD